MDPSFIWGRWDVLSSVSIWGFGTLLEGTLGGLENPHRPTSDRPDVGLALDAFIINHK